MRSFGLSLAPLLFSYISAASDIPLDCAYRRGKDNEACQRSLEAVTTVTSGSFYIAKLPCLDCPVEKTTGEREFSKHFITQEDNDLFFNITLSHDRRTILLNEKPFFPNLPTNPPPTCVADQVSPNFTRADLDNSIACTLDTCTQGRPQCWCIEPVISGVSLDYDYFAKHLESHPETQTEKWEVTFDAIGGQHGYMGDPILKFNSSKQYMLRIIVQGKEIEEERYPGEQDMQAAGSLFGPFGEEPETQYELEITSVNLVQRSYTFPAPPTSTFWRKLRHFFGADAKQKDGHIVYLREQWGGHGKKGTFKDIVGSAWEDWGYIIIIVVPSVLGGLLVLYGFYKLCLLIMRQRELARWDGMDAVWEQLRRERDDEEDGLLEGGYRDDPEGSSSPPPRYTDEDLINKPLPSKPLPEKPLPAVPLIDA